MDKSTLWSSIDSRHLMIFFLRYILRISFKLVKEKRAKIWTSNLHTLKISKLLGNSFK